MAVPVCELCKGTNFVKEEGFFVCQGCGTKYTPEEAQKLMGNPLTAQIAPAGGSEAGTLQQPQPIALAVDAQTPANTAEFNPGAALGGGGTDACAVNNYICTGWQMLLNEYRSFEHPGKDVHGQLVARGKECLLALNTLAELEPDKYVQAAILYGNCCEIAEEAARADYYEQREDGSWKSDSLTFASKMKLPGQDKDWGAKLKDARAVIRQEYLDQDASQAARLSELEAQKAALEAQLDELKDEKHAQGFFNFSGKAEVKERMAPIKEQKKQVERQIDEIERAARTYIDERITERAEGFVQL